MINGDTALATLSTSAEWVSQLPSWETCVISLQQAGIESAAKTFTRTYISEIISTQTNVL